ncbi:MAG: hypothetical protein WBG01_02710 [Bacteroidota bacterium]
MKREAGFLYRVGGPFLVRPGVRPDYGMIDQISVRVFLRTIYPVEMCMCPLVVAVVQMNMDLEHDDVVEEMHTVDDGRAG